MRLGRLSTPLCFIACWLVSTCTAQRGILAVDYGTDTYKASLIKPGVPFDVLLTKDSKRKSPSIVTLRNDERHVGSDALSLSTRFPYNAVPSVKLLLGDAAESEALYRDLYPVDLGTDQRGSHTFSIKDGPVLSKEEILAMQFANAAEMARLSGKDKVTDVIVTVPPYFDQTERQALLDAIDLAGLQPLTLLNDGTAVAVNYAIPRTFSHEPERHLFYDAGASSIRATIVAFSTISVEEYPGARTLRNATRIQVLGVGWNTAAGGLSIDTRVRDILKSRWTTRQPSSDLDGRAMARLLREASRIKHVLSANAEAQARIESLADDIDFHAAVKREEVESACADLRPHIAQPIHDALEMARLNVDALTSVVLVGGHSRVPLVQDIVRETVPEGLIAQNINADEAAVMGAALYGAAMSRQFRTKDIRVEDISVWSIHSTHNASILDPVENATLPTVFEPQALVGTTRSLFFSSQENFSMTLTAHGSGPIAEPKPLLTAYIEGTDSYTLNMSETEIEHARIRVDLHLGQDGLIRLQQARLVHPSPELKSPSVAGRVFGGLFGGGKSSVADVEPSVSVSSMPEQATGSTSQAPPPSPTLHVDVSVHHIQSLSRSEKTEARKRLREIEQAETRKRAREEARNQLESAVYRLRDQAEEVDFTRFSTKAERAAIQSALTEASAWISDFAETAPTKDLRQRQSGLDNLVKPITTRMKEEAQRPAALAALQAAFTRAETFLKSAAENASEAESRGEASWHTTEDLAALKSILDTEHSWLEDTSSRQDKLSPAQDPVLRQTDMHRRSENILKEVNRLMRKPKPRVIKSTSAAASSTISSAAADPTEAASASPTDTADSDANGGEIPLPTESSPPGRPGDEL